MSLDFTGNTIASADISTFGTFSTMIPMNELKLYLDAGNVNSYNGTGSIWYDLSGSGNHFTISPSAYSGATGSYPAFMNFRGSYGCAKKTDADISISGKVTCIVITRVLKNSGAYRTLMRGLSSGSDHQVIIDNGTWNIGMYDNTNSSLFNDSTWDQTDLRSYTNEGNWDFLAWKWPEETPAYYIGSKYGISVSGRITSVNAKFKHGFCSIGAYNNGNQTDPTNASQYWGDIGVFLLYNRVLSSEEIIRVYYAFSQRFNIS